MHVTAKPGRGKKIHIMVDGEYSFTTVDEFWFSCGFSGGEMSEEELSELKSASDYRLALEKAFDYIAVRDHSRSELIKKLSDKFSPEAAEKAADRAEELGMLDDAKFARSYAKHLAEFKGMGKRRIKSELFLKGIDRDITDEVLEELETDESAAVCELLCGKYKRMMFDEKGRKRAFAALVRLGYSYSDIRNAMRDFAQSDDFYEE